MKKLNSIILVLVCSLVLTIVAHAAYVITLTDLRMENIVIYRQDVEGQGTQVFMAMNYTLYNSGGDTKGKTVIFTLTAGQKTQVLNFIKPFVQQQAATDGVSVPTWAQ